MRISLVLCTLLISLNAFSMDDKSMQDLFKKYDALMDNKKVELIDEVFTKKFIEESGGKKELIEKIGDLPKQLVPPKTQMSWKKGNKGNDVYLAKVKEITNQKKKNDDHDAEFIVVKEDGKLKIDGTLSDDD